MIPTYAASPAVGTVTAEALLLKIQTEMRVIVFHMRHPSAARQLLTRL